MSRTGLAMSPVKPSSAVMNGSNDLITACTWCGAAMEAKPHKFYCSGQCRKSAWDKKHVTTFVSPDGKMKTTIRIK